MGLSTVVLAVKIDFSINCFLTKLCYGSPDVIYLQ